MCRQTQRRRFQTGCREAGIEVRHGMQSTLRRIHMGHRSVLAVDPGHAGRLGRARGDGGFPGPRNSEWHLSVRCLDCIHSRWRQQGRGEHQVPESRLHRSLLGRKATLRGADQLPIQLPWASSAFCLQPAIEVRCSVGPIARSRQASMSAPSVVRHAALLRWWR